jgi:hypothetical protein
MIARPAPGECVVSMKREVIVKLYRCERCGKLTPAGHNCPECNWTIYCEACYETKEPCVACQRKIGEHDDNKRRT